MEDAWRAAALKPGEVEAMKPLLLFSALYVLVPIGVAPPAWQRSVHPSGATAVRCFLSEASARLAAQAQAQIVRAPGRDLFASFGSWAAWVDPEGVSLLLSSTELQQLLKSVPAPPAVGDDSTLEAWSGASDLPSEVRTVWCALLRNFPHVTKAYWLGRESQGGAALRRFVIVTEPESGGDSSRAIDALAAALRANYSGPMRIEAQALTIGELRTAHQRLERSEPFYSRSKIE